MNLKILLISYKYSPDIGGIETCSEFLADTFCEAGHHIRILTITSGKHENSQKYTIIRNPSILRIIKSHIWADIVIENNPCLHLGFPKLFLANKSITVLHTWTNSSTKSNNIANKIKFFNLRRSKKIVAVSKAIQEHCWPEAIVIGNTYNERLFRSTKNTDNNNFVFIGRLVSDKGVELAVKAFSHLVFTESLPELSTSYLTIIGDGEERHKLETLISELPDPSRIRLVGPLRGNDLVAELNKHKFQFIPSVWKEPFGIVALEGIACGLIPIASDGGGLPDAIGNAGVLFRRGQLKSLIDVTRSLVISNQLQQQYLSAAPDHLKKFSCKTVGEKYINLINSCL